MILSTSVVYVLQFKELHTQTPPSALTNSSSFKLKIRSLLGSDFLLVTFRFFGDPGIMRIIASKSFLFVALDNGLGRGVVDVESFCDLGKMSATLMMLHPF